MVRGAQDFRANARSIRAPAAHHTGLKRPVFLMSFSLYVLTTAEHPSAICGLLWGLSRF